MEPGNHVKKTGRNLKSQMINKNVKYIKNWKSKHVIFENHFFRVFLKYVFFNEVIL
jgi:hypothetical protein